MEYIIEGLAKALELIFSLDPEIYGIVGSSVRFALTATLLAAVAGVPLGFVIGSKSFKGKPAVITLLNTLMALPTVVVGLLGYAFLSRRAPLGFLDMIFSPHAVILGEFLLSLPVITNLTVSAVQAVDKQSMDGCLDGADGSAFRPVGSHYRRVRQGCLRGRFGHDVRGQYSLLYPDHDHCDCTRGKQGGIRFWPCAGVFPSGCGVFH
jgi:hypothetical protein